MKKLFSIFCCLLLSASMVTQAANQTFTATWAQNTIANVQMEGASRQVTGYRWVNGNKTLSIYFLEPTGHSYRYNNKVCPPRGSYTITNTYAANTVTSGYADMGDGTQYNSTLKNGSTTYRLYQGTVTVAEGADGPYITTSSLSLANNSFNSIISGTHSFTIGSAATYRTVSVVSNDNAMGTTSYAMKSGYVYEIDGTNVKHWKNGSVYTLTATPKSGYRFVSWSDGGAQTHDITITGNQTYTATFESLAGQQYTVTTAVNNNSLGSVTPIGYQYENTNWDVAVTINDPANYYLSDWLRDGVSMGVRTNPLPVTVTKAETYTAVITAKEWTLTVNSDNTSLGTVSGGKKCYDGETTTITATPANSFSSFVKWQKNGVDYAGGASINVTVNANDTYTAFFSGRNIIEVDIPNATYVDRWSIYSLRGNSLGTSSENSGYYVDVACNTSNNALSSVDGIKYNGSTMSFTTKTIESIEQPCGNRKITNLACYNATGDVYMFKIHWTQPWGEDSNDTYPNDRTINANQQAAYDDDLGAIYVYGYTKEYEFNGQATLRAMGMYFVTGQRCSDDIKIPVGTYDINCSGEPGTVMSYQSGMDKDLSGGWAQTQGVEHGYYLLDKGTVTVTKSGSTYTINVNAKNSYGNDLISTMTIDESVITGTIPNYTLNVTTDGHGTAKVYRYDCSGNENLVSNSGSYKQGSYFKLEASPSSGYAFDYWTIDGVDEHFTNNPEILDGLYDNAVVTAHFVEGSTTHTLDWDVNGGTLVGTAGEDYLAAGEYEEGTTITLPDATREGYTLDYWSFTMGGVPYEESAGAEIDLDEDVTITAQWVANTYNVSFAPNGGSGTMTNQVFTYGVAQNLKANTFTAPTATATFNYNGATGGNSPASVTVTATADGWFEGNNYYEEGQSVNNLTTTNGATVALTAFWGWTEEITLPTPTKTGYEFDQWSFNMGGMDFMEDAGAEIAIEEDVDMTALWNIVTYNLTYEGLNGATNTNPTSYNVESETITLADPGARDGWTFTGWTMGGSPITEIATGSTGNKTLTANWEEAITTYTVQFLAGEHGRSVTATAGGNSISSGADVQEGSQVVLTAEAKNFYHFREWQDSNNGTQVSTDNPYTVNSLAGNLNLTAVFERDEVIVIEDTYKSDNVWYNDYKELVSDVTTSGDKVTVRYERTLTANTWNVFSLPFSYSTLKAGSTFNGSVYKLDRMEYNTDGYMTLNFLPITIIEANIPYLFYSSAAAANPTFSNVELQNIADGSYDKNNSGNAGGKIWFRNTQARTQLDAERTDDAKKKVIYLNANKLYYLSLTKETWMRAFRGYFELDETTVYYLQPRVRIVLDGQTATEVETAGQEDNSSVRKYMENGILVIEREGIRYDATGAKIN